ncbi:MAG TPA: formyltransferase family protein [Bacteroidales bacterium]|nr:formyltransferase family protein [Bacteroidales bacterium]HPT01851.1 formyltransferase family protein [Bacteroidales bacterium]
MKVGILCSSNLNSFNHKVLEHIVNLHNDKLACCYIDVRPGKSFLKKSVFHIKKRQGSYIFFMSAGNLFRAKQPALSAEDFCSRYNIPVFKTDDPYSERTLDSIRSEKIDILVYLSGFGTIIRKPLLEIAPLGVLSYHHGNMREYRGQPAAFWELYNGEAEMGATVQRINEWIDTGMPIVEKIIPIHPTDTYNILRERLYSETPEMMAEALKRYETDDFRPCRLENYGTLYRIPSAKEYLILRYRVFRRRRKWLLSQASKQLMFNYVSAQQKTKLK